MKLYLNKKNTHTHKYRVIHLKTNKHIYLLHSRNKRTKMAIQQFLHLFIFFFDLYKTLF